MRKQVHQRVIGRAQLILIVAIPTALALGFRTFPRRKIIKSACGSEWLFLCLLHFHRAQQEKELDMSVNTAITFHPADSVPLSSGPFQQHHSIAGKITGVVPAAHALHGFVANGTPGAAAPQGDTGAIPAPKSGHSGQIWSPPRRHPSQRWLSNAISVSRVNTASDLRRFTCQ